MTVSIKQTLHTKPMSYNNEIPDVDSNNNKSNDMNKNRIIIVVVFIVILSHLMFCSIWPITGKFLLPDNTEHPLRVN